ncbi:MAG: hypothetical protein DRI90_22860, partial [Deltaproteobacteria bacterium]
MAMVAVGVPGVAQDSWKLAKPTNNPPGVLAPAMAYDSARQVVVMFGGQRGGNSGPSDETWEWNGLDWRKRYPKTKPAARMDHAMVYDSHRKVCVMFGGSGHTATWEWDGIDWLMRDKGASSSDRRYIAMAYDAARKQVVRMGGLHGKAKAETLTWDGKSWTLVTRQGPRARYQHAMAYDPLRERVVLFGGHLDSFTVDETWEWDGKVWTEAKPVNQPPLRRLHQMVWMAKAGKVVVYGGVAGNYPVIPGSTWAWNGVDWSLRLHSLTNNPQEKRECAMAYDGKREQVVLYGGWSSPMRWTETWLFSTNVQVPATVAVFGKGCKGTVGIANLALHGGRLPWIGEWMELALTGLPKAAYNQPLGIIGASRTRWGVAGLPLALKPFGMPGCDLY